MSKRFGRNQKRALRQKIQEQEQIIERKSQEIEYLNLNMNEANSIIEYTAYVLGSQFISLPVQTTEVNELLSEFKYMAHPPFGMWYDRNPQSARSTVFGVLSYMETHQADAWMDNFRDLIHLRYKSKTGEVGYSISGHAWKRLPEDQLIKLIQTDIANEMATKLVRHKKQLTQPGHTK